MIDVPNAGYLIVTHIKKNLEESIIMSTRYKLLLVLTIIIALTFGVGFKLGQYQAALAVYSQSNTPQQSAKTVLPANPSNQVAAILLIPKPYVPLFEKFKHRKIARAIDILPARIGWDDGQMVAIPQKAVYRDAGTSATPVINLSHRSEKMTPKSIPDKSKIAQGAVFLFLLKGAANNKFGYTAGQSMRPKAGL